MTVSAPVPATPARRSRTGFAVTALVLGIVAACGSPIPILNNATIVAGVIGLVFGLAGLFGTAQWMSAIGLVLAAAGVAAGLLFQVYWNNQLTDIQRQVTNDLNAVQTSMNNLAPPTFSLGH